MPTILPKILVIEGHATLRDVVSQLINAQGNFQVVVAQNGLEGVVKAKTWQPDLILMGLRMPLMDGFEAIRAIRNTPATADIPIIVLSAWDNATSRQKALDAGANEHIAPPVETDRLLSRINQYLQHKL